MPRIFLPLAALALAACVGATPREVTAAMPSDDDTPAYQRCTAVQPGMNYRDALALMGREPDNTLSGHTAAGPAGEPPGSYAIDFWYETAPDGQQRVSSLHYSGGTIDSVDCGRPFDAPAAPPTVSPSSGT